ncbi:AMP-binding protein [Desulfomonile tiedjei]|uniref:Acyl-CoA synthetase (AMP-forming)/AMP-acid ligase II n=1 Tax=Desulfomonile tiedjei (strain ATCC 49306 / DSM 6799 / DCB-1) TaxID=706587 RepID=I4C7Y5_DESTA|nr:AMP-binding protein [Desulfomonile tiedjei]AFM25676.1 acyl-CoA synthetase (AMP-forming)/AMP-acid ligase II [Desulfomonile tiedjei DSM 6799]
MSVRRFPPINEDAGFFAQSVYEEALSRYPTVADLVATKAKENGKKIWMEFQDGRAFSYEDADDLGNRLATGFYQLGVRADDHVALFALNSPLWAFSYFGILKLGAVPVTVNTGFMKQPLIYNLTASASEYLIVDSRLLDRLKAVEESLPELKHVFIIGKDNFVSENAPSHAYTFVDDLLSLEPDPAHRVPRKISDPSAMILTSGTTGPSKVVYDTNAQFITTALFLIDAGGVTSESVYYSYLPLFHIMALDMAMLLSMLANAKIVLVEKFDPAVFWEHVKKYGITHFAAVGPILEMLVKMPPSPLEKDHGPITALAYSSKEIWVIAGERFNINITGGYGSTEVGIPISAPNHIVRTKANPPGACGMVGPHVEVGVMNECGELLPTGRTGEIVVRPKMPWAIFMEYYGMPEVTTNAFRGLWFHTGDAGYFDEQGYLFFVDRLKDAIRRKGENISSYEVEQILLKYHDIAQAAVVPAKSDFGDEEVMAVIVPASDRNVSPDAIVSYAKENMPHFWVPRYIRFMDALPATATGRIEKFRLREQGVTPDTYDRRAVRNE